MSQVEFTATLDIKAHSEAAMTAFAVNHLKERGYHVAPPRSKSETPSDFMKRLGLTNWGSLHRDIALWLQGGGNLTVYYYQSGRRLREIQSNAEFDKFVLRFKRPVRLTSTTQNRNGRHGLISPKRRQKETRRKA